MLHFCPVPCQTMDKDRMPVASTRMNLRTLEQRLKNVERGYALLKCKSDALQIHFREVETEIVSKTEKMNRLFSASFKSLNEARYFGADIEGFRKECTKSPVSLETSISQVCGVNLASFRVIGGSEDTTVLMRGSHKLRESKQHLRELLAVLVDLCSSKNALDAFKRSLEMTNKRKNSLEYKVIPVLQSTAGYIRDQLDEAEREEFFRLKKIQTHNRV